MHDIRSAIRALRAAPVTTAVAALSLALGIGANTAIFSLVNSLILRALPVVEPNRLVLLSAGTSPVRQWSYSTWEQIRQQTKAFDGTAAWFTLRFNLAPGGEVEAADGMLVSGDFFATLGVPMLLGRNFSSLDDQRGGGADGPVAVISYPFWQRKFGGASTVIGTRVLIERVPFTVVGITPPGFFGVEVGRTFDVAVPIGTEPLIRGRDSLLDRTTASWLRILIRLKPGQSVDSATTALRGLQPQIRAGALPHEGPQPLQGFLKEPFTLTPAASGTSGLRQQYERPLMALFVVVTVVFLIAGVNVASLLLARTRRREYELSVRLALGASRWRLARQLVAESVVLAGVGALLGLVVATWTGRAIVAYLSTPAAPIFLELTPDWRVVTFTVILAMAAVVVCGTGPALRASHAAPMDALRAPAQSASERKPLGIAHLFVVVQFALSLVLVVAAALFVGTFTRLADVALGFESERVLLVNVSTKRTHVESLGLGPFCDRLVATVAGLPGVAQAAASVVTPVSGTGIKFMVDVPNALSVPLPERVTEINFVTPQWFDTYGMRVRAGRDIDRHDTMNASSVAIVNEAFQRTWFGTSSALNRSVAYNLGPKTPAKVRTIVGVVNDAVYGSPREGVRPTVYIPLAQWDLAAAPLDISIAVRSATRTPMLLARGIANALTTVDRDTVFTFRPLADQVSASLARERLLAILSGGFGTLALLLAALGVYGITSDLVNRHRREMGIRLVLGASPMGIVRRVMLRIALVVAIGLVLGGLASIWLSQFAAGLLYGLQPSDPLTISAAAVTLAAVGALAGWLGANRVARIDPAETLRSN